MKANKLLYKGKRLLLPYKDQMNIVISSQEHDCFDVKGLENNRTGKYLNCFNITKFLSKNQLTVKAIHSTSPEVIITYQNNGEKGNLVVDNETIEINLDDSIIALMIDDDLNMHIDIFSNDEFVDEKIMEQKTQQNEELKEEQHNLRQQYQTLKEENEQLIKRNTEIKKNIENLQKENEEYISQQQQYQKDIQVLQNMFDDNKSQKDVLENQFHGGLKHYGITLDIFKEYQTEVNSQDIENKLKDVKELLDQIEGLLKQYIEARQKQVDKIHDLVKPQ